MRQEMLLRQEIAGGIARESDRKMRIIRSLVKRIGGEMRIDRRDNNQDARFTVLFS